MSNFKVTAQSLQSQKIDLLFLLPMSSNLISMTVATSETVFSNSCNFVAATFFFVQLQFITIP